MRRKQRGKTREHSKNAAVALVALVLLGYASYVSPPRELVSRAGEMLGSAAVGVAAGVPENPYNTLAQQLQAKEAELNEREAALRGNDAGTAQNDGFFNEPMAVVSFFISIILFVLLLLNYYFDWHRQKYGKVQTA